ncbi:MAG: amidohydrolase family protein [Bacteroidota bacterium]
MDKNITTIDAHQHFWNYHPETHSWISDDMSVLKRDFLAADLKAQFDQNGVAGSIAVQADQSERETLFLLELAAQNDFIKGVVGWVDLRSPAVEDRLAHFAAFPKMKGVRHVVQDEPDVHFVLGEAFQRGIAALAKYKLTYDILIFPSQLEAVLQLVKNFPEQPFVVDHIAKPYIKDGKIDQWAKQMRAIAQHPNVYCKLSGMITEANWTAWSYADFVPYMDVVFEAFGMDRVMFGSDFPVCLLAGSYQKVKGLVQEYTQSFSLEAKQKIWGVNALRFYNLSKETLS